MPADLQQQIEAVIKSYAESHRAPSEPRKPPTKVELQASIEAALADLYGGFVYTEAHVTPMLQAALEAAQYLLGGPPQATSQAKEK
jgi:hypothetical protein